MNAHAPSQRSILVIEDDPHSAALLKFCLVRAGFDVRLAADGEQALYEFDQPQLPELIIMDIMLPYHSGYELLAELRRRPDWVRVPVIMLTGRSEEDDVVQCLDLGANDFLTKPFRPAELMARIHKLLVPASNVAP